MFTTKDVVRLSDRWFDHRHPDAISRQSRLQSCVVLVTVFHLVMSIAFAKIDEYERAHSPRRVAPSEYAFEFMIAPPELKHVVSIPKPITLIDGKQQNTGGFAGARQGKQKAAAPIPDKDMTPHEVKKIAINTTPPPLKRLITQPTDIPSMNPHPIKNQDEAVISPGGEKVDEDAEVKTRGITDDGAGETEHGSGNFEGIDGEQEGYDQDNLPSQGSPVKSVSSSSQVKVNIAPYRKQMLIKLSQQWEPPTKKAVQVLLLIDIANDGSLISAAVVGSSGNKKIDREALAAVHRTAFEPFPEDIAVVLKHCRFQINLRNF